MINGCDFGFVVMKSFLNIDKVSPKALTKAGPTWLSLGWAIDTRTASSNSIGPGIKSVG
jgi:hypothetical protein